MKILITFIIILTSILSASAQLVINEYSGANVSNHTDNNGDNTDWIELYNPTGSAIDLTGWYFTDKASKPFKNQIASGSVPANGKLMVYCTGRDMFTGTVLHTSFKLTQTKPETIMISDAAGLLVDSITMKPCQKNHSRGRSTDGALTWSLFTTPTPNAVNSNPKTDYAAKPILSLASGIHPAGVSVTITTTQPASTIYYTLDGTTPNVGSAVFTGPVNIATSKVLRAIVISTDPNFPNSFVETNSYLIGISHTMPIVSISGDEILDFINDDWNVNAFTDDFDGAFEFFTSAGTLIDEGEGIYNKHGNDSWAYDQRGFDFEMQDQYGYNYAVQDEIFRVSNRDEYDKLIIKAAANDNYPFETGGAYIRDAYVHSLSQIGDLKMDERSYEPCVLYVNGAYWGLYELREKVDDSDFTNEYYDQKEIYNGSDTNIQFLKTWGATWNKYGNAPAQNDWDAFVAYVNANNMAVQANFDVVDAQYNWKSLVDYMVMNSYIVCGDWLNYNTAWWRGLDPNGDKKKWRYVLWDMDASFGHYINYTGVGTQGPEADPCEPENLPDPGGQGHTVILNKLMQNPTFEQYYISRYIDLSNTTFSCDFMIQHLDSLIGLIEPEMNNQIARWGGNYSTWQANVQTLKDFINDRCIEMNQGMIDCYNLNGPYDIVYDVTPVGSGEIKVNSVNLASYPWSGSYFGGIDVLLKANANAGYNFAYWELIDPVVIDPDSADVSFQPTMAQNVIAHFQDENDTTVLVNYEGINIPTAFSPNGDGQNDLLDLFIGNDILDFKLEIFNRWGEMVFVTTERNVFWDGTYKDADLNTGVFVYQLNIRFEDGKSERRVGNITLMK
ncbi:MAG: gliding motility-associated-like protein [Parvicella sp.]|jgi:gliding motility-associated-like protein